MIDKLGESLLSVTGKLGDLIRAGNANSLTEFTQSAHILPVFLMDSSVALMTEAEAIIGGVLNYYAACYLMAAQMSVNIGDINVTRQLERLNTRRSPLNAGIGMANTLLHMESYTNGLPNPKQAKLVENLEGIKFESKDSETGMGAQDETTAQTARGVIDRIEANSKLSIGKTLEVNWESNGHRGTVVVSLRPSIQTTSDASMTNILSIGTKNLEFKERMHGIKSGTLHWFYDGVLAMDVIKEMRKARIQDNTGYYADALARHRKNKISSIISLNPSVAQLSSVFIISAETARDLEVRTNLNLKKFKDRQKMFENSFGMVLVVVDKAWKNCKIYSHGIQDYTTVSFSQLDGVSKGKGGDIKEMLNALMLSDAPRF